MIIIKSIINIIKKILVFLIKTYKKTISPVFEFFGFKCKFHPTCSEYMIEALEKYGIIKGIYLGLKRILRCNPFSKGGYDPLK